MENKNISELLTSGYDELEREHWYIAKSLFETVLCSDNLFGDAYVGKALSIFMARNLQYVKASDVGELFSEIFNQRIVKNFCEKVHFSKKIHVELLECGYNAISSLADFSNREYVIEILAFYDYKNSRRIKDLMVRYCDIENDLRSYHSKYEHDLYNARKYISTSYGKNEALHYAPKNMEQVDDSIIRCKVEISICKPGLNFLKFLVCASSICFIISLVCLSFVYCFPKGFEELVLMAFPQTSEKEMIQILEIIPQMLVSPMVFSLVVFVFSIFMKKKVNRKFEVYTNSLKKYKEIKEQYANRKKELEYELNTMIDINLSEKINGFELEAQELNFMVGHSENLIKKYNKL